MSDTGGTSLSAENRDKQLLAARPVRLVAILLMGGAAGFGLLFNGNPLQQNGRPAHISMQIYRQIEMGQTYEEVCSLIGTTGTRQFRDESEASVLSETGEDYEWTNASSPGVLMGTFEDGRLTLKAQRDLPEN